MEAAINRKQTSFRLRTDLLKQLQVIAREENRSLNDFVESLLMDAVYNEPNAVTLAAMEEARLWKNLKTVDMSNFESFVKSCSE